MSDYKTGTCQNCGQEQITYFASAWMPKERRYIGFCQDCNENRTILQADIQRGRFGFPWAPVKLYPYMVTSQKAQDVHIATATDISFGKLKKKRGDVICRPDYILGLHVDTPTMIDDMGPPTCKRCIELSERVTKGVLPNAKI